MPLARFNIPAHVPLDRVVALANAVHDGLVATCRVPINDRFQLITRFAPGDILMDPNFPNVQRTPDASIVEITFLAGRTDTQKHALYRHVTQQASAAGWHADDVMIALVENSAVDWCLGRGESFAAP